MAKSLTGRSWFDIRTNGAKYQTELNRMKASVTNAPNEVVKGYYAEIRNIAWDAARLARQHILTDTNTRKYRETGKAGRYQTGTMASAFWANVRKESDKHYKINVGYLGGKPGYAIFQEYGTRQGLAGVEALRVSQEYIDTQVRKLGRGGRNYRSKLSEAVRDGEGVKMGQVQPPAWFKRK